MSVDESHTLERIGSISHLVGNLLIVQGDLQATIAFDSDSIVCLEDRTIVGKVCTLHSLHTILGLALRGLCCTFDGDDDLLSSVQVEEVFGPVTTPLYSIRFNSDQEIDEKFRVTVRRCFFYLSSHTRAQHTHTYTHTLPSKRHS